MTTKEHMEAKIQQLIAKCDRLTRERDEARRMVCDQSYDDPNGVARKLGWDCYKDKT